MFSESGSKRASIVFNTFGGTSDKPAPLTGFKISYSTIISFMWNLKNPVFNWILVFLFNLSISGLYGLKFKK